MFINTAKSSKKFEPIKTIFKLNEAFKFV